MQRTPTVVDVATVAQVSRQTVSNVLNSPDIVRPATRERVERAIAELGYRPNAAARRLRTQRSSTLGIRLDHEQNGISGVVLDRFLHALVEAADARGFRVLLFTADSPEDEIAQIEALIEGADADGFVITATAENDPRLSWLHDHDVPFVSFGRPWGVPLDVWDSYPWVDIDGRAGVRGATQHFLAAGTQRIGYLGWPTRFGQDDERRQGWVEAMDAAGTPRDGLELAVEDDVDAAAAAVRTALSAGVDFEAVVCASDTLALGARMALPAAVPVVGYDDTPVAGALGMPSVAQPLGEAARAVVDVLLGSTGHAVLPAPAGHHLLEPSVVWR
ncbi:LacI family DNA-binding transcriptional regulator [Curtobacterium sp. APC 4022]|uniref:LacI family DNA-binding transcriptional regulator n=1 Tax=Curtobacterium sp. APC 4022 TaxID=3035201 RepID=UPI0025B4A03D|nr:LacI family DNA-binding transcriptional regulator [Curtobacterium sp. APC 4022]MDN3479478.1 LacI family DNA-binding transcriptional regulator [Curtobacterium sp. APC 4022]